MDCSNFAHAALDKDADEIRVIALQPCSDSSITIECKILHVRLSDQPRHEALSYMWGSESDPRVIEIEGTEHHVRQNLWLALERLRLPTQERILWIDAICINQAETRERNHQVSLMSSICSHATCVVAWLGPEADGSHEMDRVYRADR